MWGMWMAPKGGGLVTHPYNKHTLEQHNTTLFGGDRPASH